MEDKNMSFKKRAYHKYKCQFCGIDVERYGRPSKLEPRRFTCFKCKTRRQADRIRIKRGGTIHKTLLQK